MGILFIIFLLYAVWGVPVAILFNFLLTKNIAPHFSKMGALSVSVFSTLVLFMPLVTESNSFFSDSYMPWYISLIMTPPEPSFSFFGFTVTVGVSAVTSLLTMYFVAPKTKGADSSAFLEKIFSRFGQ